MIKKSFMNTALTKYHPNQFQQVMYIDVFRKIMRSFPHPWTSDNLLQRIPVTLFIARGFA